MFGVPVRQTQSGTVHGRSGRLLGFFVASTSEGTIELRDGAGTELIGTMTPAVGWYALPIGFAKSLEARLGGALDVTFVLAP